VSLWAQHGCDPADRLRDLEARLRADEIPVLHGGPFDRFDLEVRLGVLGAGRLLMAVEEHGAGCQLVRLRLWPRIAWGGGLLAAGLAALAIGALSAQAWAAGFVLAAAAGGLLLRAVSDCAAGVDALAGATDAHADAASLERIERPARPPR
jgi:hypothetical protein